MSLEDLCFSMGGSFAAVAAVEAGTHQPPALHRLVSIDRLCTNKVNEAFVPLDVAEGVGFACSKFIFFS